MILTHEDYQAIEDRLGADAAPIIRAFEKLEREQSVEVKRALLVEIATKSDLAELRSEFKEDIANLKVEVKEDIANLKVEVKEDIANLRTELRTDLGKVQNLLKLLIAVSVVAMSLFSPAVAELIRLLK